MIRFIFRWLFRLLLLGIVLAVAAILVKDTIIKSLVTTAVARKIGLPVKIGVMEVGLLTPTVSLENIVIYNSAEFGGAPFLEIPELYIEYDLRDARNRETHFHLMRLKMREINIVESAQGKTNLFELLKRVVPGGFSLHRPKGSRKLEHFRGIDVLNLSVDHVKYTSLRNPRHNQETAVAIRNDIIQNVSTEQDISAILLKIFLRAGITIFYDAPVRASTNHTQRTGTRPQSVTQ
jgi:hypothetical protein